MRSNLGGACPNCRAQIVLWDDGFECSICGYTLAMWTAFLGHEEFPLHTDSPALVAGLRKL